MRVLIAEDNFASRKLMQRFLSQYGECDLVVDGLEALDAYLMAFKEGKPYDLICLDIMMPKLDGVKVLKAIRDLERQKGVSPEKGAKIIMLTALAEAEYVRDAFLEGCEAYAAKPIDLDKLSKVMRKLGFEIRQF